MPTPRLVLPLRLTSVPRIPDLPDPAPKSKPTPKGEDLEPHHAPGAKRAVDRTTLSSYGMTYFKLLVIDYRSIINPQPPAVRSQLDALIEKPGAPESWDDVYMLERGLISILPEADLRARILFLRSEFEAAATADEYQDYLRTPPPDPQNGPLDKLRADSLSLIDQIQWRAITTPFFESLRSTILLRLVLCTAFYIVVTSIVLYNLQEQPDHYCFHLLVAMLCGILGGAISTTQRIQSLPTNSTTLTNLKSMQGWHVALLTSPLIGGVSAGLLFFLCAGQELPSTVFPSLTEYDTWSHGTMHVFVGGGAADFPNAAKLVIWSFIAGFSERFIPDTISRLTAKLSS